MLSSSFNFKKLFLSFVAFTLISLTAHAQFFHSWRGPERDGWYHETNLLKEWPVDGPVVKWTYEDLGKGFTSPVIANGNVYITGMEGEVGYVYILNMKGELKQKLPYGEEISASYPGTRSTPTIIGDTMYVTTGHGKLICFDLSNGSSIWTKDLFSDFDGQNIRWGITENLLIDGDALFVAPGGEKFNVVALNRHNGNLIWSSKGKGELSGYHSPLVINHNNNKILITMMGENVLAMDATTGNLLWTYPYKNRHNIYPNTPIYHDNSLLLFSGYGKGSVKLDLNSDGSEFIVAWTNDTLDNQMGGVILKDGYLYGSGHNNRRWFCVDWETGEIKQESREIDKGTVIAADGMLYAYTERGELVLIEPLPGSFNIVSQTEIKLGSEQHWAHLVISNGVLYVRHGNALIAFNIRKDS